MGLGLAAKKLAELIQVTAEIAVRIIALAEGRESQQAEEERRGSLVVSYATGLLNDCRQYQNIGAVAVLRSGLKHDKSGDIHYLGSAIIAVWGYDVYIINSGWIRNDDARGFENWAVVGNSTQKDNTINVP